MKRTVVWMLGAAAIAGGCLADHEEVAVDDDTTAQIRRMVDSGGLILELGEAAGDPEVEADVAALLGGALGSVPGLELAADPDHRLQIQYLGKGRAGKPPSGVPRGADRGTIEPASGQLAFDGFNPATGNEFRISMSSRALGAVGARSIARGLDRGGEVSRADIDAETLPQPTSWSNGDDDRTRLYGVNAAVTSATHRRLVQLGSGCSGALVGPRHIVTAGHCLWDRDDQTWSDDFTVRAGRNGTQNSGSVVVDNDNIPGGQVVWYFTPSQYRVPGGDTWGYDFGILVVPARLGDVTGWLGRVSIAAADIGDYSIVRRGYPLCSASIDGVPRIDEPVPCSANHLYGNTGACSVGEYEELDGDGWSRIVHHSCDASAGDSGSALYVTYNGTPSLWAVHFFSHCEKTEDDDACTGDWEDRPLGALRLTPEYRDWIAHFRDTFP